ncbi:hypothetical protein H0H87_006332 [Tephrocybe sp. NHM501043]|nr:hypothetical protein H0H87_006332 [Tephrocybe sp. NHM501043]
MSDSSLKNLHRAAFSYPAIDNHAHSLLRAENRADIAFEGLVSHLDGEALARTALHTLACYQATQQLIQLFELKAGSSWEDVKAKRAELEYADLCRLAFGPTGIQCILIDDGFGVKEILHDIPWHDQFTHSPAKQVIRIESVAEDILKEVFESYDECQAAFHTFTSKLATYLTEHVKKPSVVAFKSVVCYRSGLAVTLSKPHGPASKELLAAFAAIYERQKHLPRIRLQEKLLNDHVVNLAMEISSAHDVPIQFHTGLGDDDLMLDLASPSHLQPLIKAYPRSKVVLLHASYPYSQEAGYLTSVSPNVYLDFGEIFPYISAHGQRAVIRQILEMAPTNKIMWSTDGHFWPESYYLGTIQARKALYEVLGEIVHAGELSETASVDIVQKVLFHNANELYKLNLEPNITLKK